ncbi:hypothetical protein [Demequina sp.]|uniref:hypothetical protein n=1 Tax=Demequina sp. TaxID=2050685 RepID=UPI003A847ED4
MTRRGWSVGIVGAFVCLVVAACGGDPGPVVTPSPSLTPTEVAATVSPVPSPTPTPSPSATTLTEAEILAAIPEDARHEDYPSSVAFAAEYLRRANNATTTHDLDWLEYVSDAECAYCTLTRHLIETDMVAGVSRRGGDMMLDAAAALGGLQVDGRWRVELPVETTDATYVGPDGVVVDEVPGEELTMWVFLEYVNGHWKVIEVAL